MSILDLRSCHYFYVRLYICMYHFKFIKIYVTFVNAGTNSTYIKKLAVLKSLWGQYVEERKIYMAEVKACGQKKNLVPFGNCRKCRRRCGG